MKILFLDDEPSRHEVFANQYQGHQIWHAYSIERFEKHLEQVEKFDVISFDFDLGENENGLDCAELMLQRVPYSRWPRECWVHSSNTPGTDRLVHSLRAAGIPTERR